MSKFKFEVPVSLDSASAYSKVKKMLNGENDFKKFDSKVSCSFEDGSKSVNITGSQFTAVLKIKDNDEKSCSVVIEVELPLALSFFKGKIQEVIEKNIKNILT